MDKFGFVRIAACSPEVAIGNPVTNVAHTAAMFKEIDADVYLFPELGITAYTCGDLFGQDILLEQAKSQLNNMTSWVDPNKLVVVGFPFAHKSNLYNCAAVINQNKVVGIVPKQFLPTYNEFYEKRWFQAGEGLETELVDFMGYQVPFGPNLLFNFKEATIGIEICEDLWMPIPPSCHHTINGANIILNLSASNETVGKAAYRRDLIKNQSGRCVCAYVYASAGPTESTTDLVFGGHSLIAENGVLLEESSRVGNGNKLSSYIVADVDCKRLNHKRHHSTSFGDAKSNVSYHSIPIELVYADGGKSDLKRPLPKHPFIPDDPALFKERCEEILGIQMMSFVQRLRILPEGTMINIGVSGGLDSTLALLVACKACDYMKISRRTIRGITMPGFGTTEATKFNGTDLMQKLGVTCETINIRQLSLQVFNDMGHCPFGIGSANEDPTAPLTMEELEEGLRNLPPDSQDLTFENVQARVRTLMLMSHGFTAGTGDLSELALGWCTFNGDHMSNYNVNSSAPKGMIKFLIKYLAEYEEVFASIKTTLLNIVKFIISPELLPSKDGEKPQDTEGILGPYELHEFFMEHFKSDGSTPEKIAYLARLAFKGNYTSGFIKDTLYTYYYKFFLNQFKKNAVPDGPKIGSISFNPRGDWRMASDADVGIWTDQVKEL